jgi:hypothetical protein
MLGTSSWAHAKTTDQATSIMTVYSHQAQNIATRSQVATQENVSPVTKVQLMGVMALASNQCLQGAIMENARNAKTALQVLTVPKETKMPVTLEDAASAPRMGTAKQRDSTHAQMDYA